MYRNETPGWYYLYRDGKISENLDTRPLCASVTPERAVAICGVTKLAIYIPNVYEGFSSPDWSDIIINFFNIYENYQDMVVNIHVGQPYKKKGLIFKELDGRKLMSEKGIAVLKLVVSDGCDFTCKYASSMVNNIRLESLYLDIEEDLVDTSVDEIREKLSNDSGIGYMTITPEFSSELISRNKRNRSIRPAFVDQLATIIQQGNWIKESCDCIGICKDGFIANGQHRLHAIVKAGIPVEVPIMFDVPNDARLYIDSGKSRTAVDLVKLQSGKDHFTKLASSAVRYIVNNGDSLGVFEKAEFAKVYEKEIRAVNDMFYASPKFIQTPATYAAVFLALIHNVDSQKLLEFVNILVKGVCKTDEGEFAIMLRNILVEESSTRTNARKLSRSLQVMRAQVAIKHFVKHSKVTRLVTPRDYIWPQIPKSDFIKEQPQ